MRKYSSFRDAFVVILCRKFFYEIVFERSRLQLISGSENFGPSSAEIFRTQITFAKVFVLVCSSTLRSALGTLWEVQLER